MTTWRTGERRIECAVQGETLKYEAVFAPGSVKNPVDSVAVTFRMRKPSSSDAETIVRRCLKAATTSVLVDYEILPNAWFNDDGPLPLIDGAGHLAYDPKTSKVQTWNERQSVRPVQVKRVGYTVTYQEDKIAVPPFGKFATINVLFQRPREQGEVLKILTTEVQAAVSEQSTKLGTTACAMSGPATDRAAQKQIRGESGVS
jgi:hypothetical protein